jgi:hypothetical protein
MDIEVNFSNEDIILFDNDKKIRVIISRNVILDNGYQENKISVMQFYNYFNAIVKKNLSSEVNLQGYFISKIYTEDFQYRGIYNQYINSNLRIVCESIEYFEEIEKVSFNDEEFKKWFNILNSIYLSFNQDINFSKLSKELKVNRLTDYLRNNYTKNS